MLKTFRHAYRLRMAYKTNSVIFALKSLPLIRRLLPSSLYAASGLKTFALVLSIIWEILTVFSGKLIYLSAMVLAPVLFAEDIYGDSFVHIFAILSVIGGILNSNLLEVSMDKYYALFCMRMSPMLYTLTDFCYFLLKTLVGFLPFTLLFGAICGVDTAICALMPLFVVLVKLAGGAVMLFLHRPRRDGTIPQNNGVVRIIISLGILAAAYLPPVFGFSIPERLFWPLLAVAAAAGIAGLVYILRFRHYRALYRELLRPENIAAANTSENSAVRQNVQKTISDVKVTSSKTGYKYLNDIFVKRHAKLLSRPAKITALVCLCVMIIAAALAFFLPEAAETINDMLLHSLPLFLFVMYLINKGAAIAQAMFMNCDHSLLSYRFYRQPKAILALFTERLRYITLINLLPASVIALGLPLLLFISGGTDQPINYLLLFVSIIAMSVFFSVHNLVLYYLLQPYNFEMELKSPAYRIVNVLTYYICYIAIQIELPTFYFCIAVTGFCVVYVLVALVLAYTLAPKTFKLHR